jgi:hypothetical protein
MRTELEIEQLGKAPNTVRRPLPKKRGQGVRLEWIAAAAAVVLLLLLGWYLFSSREPKKVAAAGASARSIAISKDGSLLAVGLLDGSLRVVNTHSGKTVAVYKSDKPEQPLAPVTAVAFGPGDSILVLRARESKLHIFSSSLASHIERSLHPNAHDLVWSSALDSALVLTGGDDDLQAKIEVFPAHPMGIQRSTAQLLSLTTWSTPKHITASADGSRLAISYSSTRKMNVLLYDPRARRSVSALLIRGEPQGLAFAPNATRLWVTSPQAETVTEVTGFTVAKTEFPKLASTSPPRMIAASHRKRQAYTTGSLTFAEVDLDRRRIVRTAELPERSAGIVLSPDESTAYVTFEKLDIIGVVDLSTMRWVREIQLR